MRKNIIQRVISVLGLSMILLVALSACGSSPEKLIVGTWQNTDGVVLQFNRDGTMSGSPLSAYAVPGTYSWEDETNITMVWNAPDLEQMGGTWYVDIPIAFPAVITTLTEDTLEMNFFGYTYTFTRVK